jgi:ribosome-associated protein
VALIAEATHAPKPRRPTKPSRAAKARRVDEKKRRGALKSTRSGAFD